MAFLNPLVLAGLIAAAIPLVVHIYNFRRPRRMDYSSLALLHALKRTTIQRMRIRQWLLLLLRTLAICALIAAFARPILTGASETQFLGRANISMALVLDNSLSMTLGDAGGSYLTQARTSAETVIEQALSNDEIFVMAASESTPRRVSDIPHIEASAVTVSAAEAIQRAAEYLHAEGVHLNKAVYFMGDLQESALVDTTTYPIPPGTHVGLIPALSPNRPNVAVTGATITSRIVETGEPVKVEATVINNGVTPVENWVVSLYLEGERVAQTGVSLEPDLPTQVTLTAIPKTGGWLTGYVESEDDIFYQDNRTHFTLYVPEAQDILIVGGPEAQTFNLELALALRDSENTLRTHVIETQALSATPLNRYDALFLVSPAALSSGELMEITRYVDQGGGLMLFPSNNVSASNALLEALGAGSWQIQESVQTLMEADFEHPLFEGVFEAAAIGRSQQLEPVEVYRIAAYTPGAGLENAVIRLSGGQSFLQEIRYGLGHVLVMVVPPENSWSNLPVRGLFVPLLYRAAHYLSAGESVQGDRLVVGQPANIRVRTTDSRLHIITPSGLELVPEQRQVFGATLLDIQINEPGITDVMVDDHVVRRLSVSMNPRESRLIYVSLAKAAEELSRALDTTVEVMEDVRLDAAPEALAHARHGLNLWRHFLIAALLLLTAEMLLAMRWRAD